MNDVDFAQGLLMVFDRDRSKLLFGAKDPDSLLAVLDGVRSDRQLWKDGLIISCRKLADALQQALSECDVPDESLRPALEQTFLGGRSLADGPPLVVSLVRPDIVPHVYAALKRVPSAAVKAKLPEAVAGAAYELFLSTRAVYEIAAEERSAVVYAAAK